MSDPITDLRREALDQAIRYHSRNGIASNDDIVETAALFHVFLTGTAAAEMQVVVKGLSPDEFCAIVRRGGKTKSEPIA